MTQPLYHIRRFYFDDSHPDHRKIIRVRLTLKEAQEHCNDPATHEYDDDENVVWFDGYEEEPI